MHLSSEKHSFERVIYCELMTKLAIRCIAWSHHVVPTDSFGLELCKLFIVINILIVLGLGCLVLFVLLRHWEKLLLCFRCRGWRNHEIRIISKRRVRIRRRSYPRWYWFGNWTVLVFTSSQWKEGTFCSKRAFYFRCILYLFFRETRRSKIMGKFAKSLIFFSTIFSELTRNLINRNLFFLRSTRTIVHSSWKFRMIKLALSLIIAFFSETTLIMRELAHFSFYKVRTIVNELTERRLVFWNAETHDLYIDGFLIINLYYYQISPSSKLSQKFLFG